MFSPENMHTSNILQTRCAVLIYLETSVCVCVEQGQQSMKSEAMNLKASKEGYVWEFGGRKGNGKWSYYHLKIKETIKRSYHKTYEKTHMIPNSHGGKKIYNVKIFSKSASNYVTFMNKKKKA